MRTRPSGVRCAARVTAVLSAMLLALSLTATIAAVNRLSPVALQSQDAPPGFAFQQLKVYRHFTRYMSVRAPGMSSEGCMAPASLRADGYQESLIDMYRGTNDGFSVFALCAWLFKTPSGAHRAFTALASALIASRRAPGFKQITGSRIGDESATGSVALSKGYVGYSASFRRGNVVVVLAYLGSRMYPAGKFVSVAIAANSRLR